jgi:hypothetical protein
MTEEISKRDMVLRYLNDWKDRLKVKEDGEGLGGGLSDDEFVQLQALETIASVLEEEDKNA